MEKTHMETHICYSCGEKVENGFAFSLNTVLCKECAKEIFGDVFGDDNKPTNEE